MFVMTTSTFLDTLRYEVGRMQAAHPEREAELARAHALILHGMVVPSPDDPETGQVLSSDGHKVYHVNGTCDCEAGQHGRACKHVHSWRLYQYVERKRAAQAPQEATQTAQTTCDMSGTSHAPTGLPEAPVSITLKGTLHGQDVMVTLRGVDFASVKAQVEAAAQWLQSQTPAQASSPTQERGKDWCAIHNVAMKENHKDGRTWYSHKTAQGWCKGR